MPPHRGFTSCQWFEAHARAQIKHDRSDRLITRASGNLKSGTFARRVPFKSTEDRRPDAQAQGSNGSIPDRVLTAGPW
jgi:hypothetical protein